jgi:hypothetical protein
LTGKAEEIEQIKKPFAVYRRISQSLGTMFDDSHGNPCLCASFFSGSYARQWPLHMHLLRLLDRLLT